MLDWSADANTSAGAPFWICVTSADEASKLNVTFAPGLASSKSWPICVNACFNDDAADTVIEPVTFAAPVVVVEELADDDFALLPQAATRTANTANTNARHDTRDMKSSGHSDAQLVEQRLDADLGMLS